MHQFLLSPEDEHLRGLGWYVTSQKYIRRNLGAGRYELLHRVISGAVDGQFVDHINGDPSDNRRENLRICTHAENMMNRKMHKSNAIGIKGVYQNRNKFRAQIRVNGKVYRLGSFCTPQDAGAAYLAAASKLHGEFVRQS